jgi:3-hydroxyacyl-[acyl-carrier-protein] dehydratase
MDETKAAGGELATADIAKVMQLLPHRYPFLLVDRIVEMDRDESAVGIKNVTINEPFFQGHFPKFPVMPGVLIIEAMAQTAGALCVHHSGTTDIPQIIFFMGIDNAKFRKPVVPGDQLRLHVKKIRSRGAVWRFKCEAKVDGKLVCEADISAMIVDPTHAQKS